MNWRDKAACADVPLDDLFGPEVVQTRLAATLCASCPVIEPCRDEARRTAWGLLGGWPQGHPDRPTAAGVKHRRQPIVNPPDTCTVDGCDREHWKAGWCLAHYHRVVRTGDPRPHVPIGEGNATPDVDWVGVVSEVAAEHGVPVSAVLGRGRQRRYVVPRQVAMCRLRDEGWSFPAIGRVFGRDHTTVLHAVRKMGVAA